MLDDALPLFSVDIVGLIASYVVCGTAARATDTDTLAVTHSFIVPPACGHIARIDDDCLWLACGKVHIFSPSADRGGFAFSHFAAPERIQHATAIAADTNGEVMVLEDYPRAVVVCALDGRYLRKFSLPFKAEHSCDLYSPGGLAVDGKGLIFILVNIRAVECGPETLDERVMVYNRRGQFIHCLPDRTGDNRGDPTFRPSAIAVSDLPAQAATTTTATAGSDSDSGARVFVGCTVGGWLHGKGDGYTVYTQERYEVEAKRDKDRIKVDILTLTAIFHSHVLILMSV